MTRIAITLAEDLERRARQRARKLGMSLPRFVRQCVEWRLEGRGPQRERDSLFREPPVSDAETPADLSTAHDRPLYDEAG